MIDPANLTDADKLAQTRANFQVIVGIAIIANQSIVAGDDDTGFRLLDNFDRFVDDSYYCNLSSVTDPVITAKIDIIANSDMHKDYLAFMLSGKYLRSKLKGIDIEMNPSYDVLMRSRGVRVDTTKSDRDQIKDILAWFVAGAAQTFYANQDQFQ